MTEETPRLVWDVRNGDWFTPNRAQKTAWLVDHGLPIEDIYRIEFYLIDTPVARLFCYDRDGQGRHRWSEHHTPDDHDHSVCDVARKEPYDVRLRELPGPDLLV